MSQTFTDLQALADHLDSLNFFHMDLSLDRMNAVLEAMGLRRPPYATVQVVGTNGKGSTATFLASMLEAHGLRVGLYTSPHFHSPTERVQINGEWTDMLDWLEPASQAVQLCPQLTYFELVTVVGLELFRREQVDVAVLEAGLGARYDATTAAAADMAVFTPVALDHTALLGGTAAEIAAEKAHAVRSTAPVVTAPQTEDVMAVLQARCQEFGAPLTYAFPVDAGTVLGLAGEHQRVNAGTAVAALRALATRFGMTVDEGRVREGLASAFVPGRLQQVAGAPAQGALPSRPRCVLDGAHNPHGMATLVRALETGVVPLPNAVVYSCLADKDWRGALGQLAEMLAAVPWIVPAIPGERSERPVTVADYLMEHGVTAALPCGSCREGFQALEQMGVTGPVLVTGSLYLLSTFYDLWPDALCRN